MLLSGKESPHFAKILNLGHKRVNKAVLREIVKRPLRPNELGPFFYAFTKQHPKHPISLLLTPILLSVELARQRIANKEPLTHILHQVFKMMNKLEQIDPGAFFQLNAQNKVTRGHSSRFYKPRPRLDIRKNSFSVRVVNDWNSLPQSLIDSGTLDEFKANLDEFWKDEIFKNPFSN